MDLTDAAGHPTQEVMAAARRIGVRQIHLLAAAGMEAAWPPEEIGKLDAVTLGLLVGNGMVSTEASLSTTEGYKERPRPEKCPLRFQARTTPVERERAVNVWREIAHLRLRATSLDKELPPNHFRGLRRDKVLRLLRKVCECTGVEDAISAHKLEARSCFFRTSDLERDGERKLERMVLRAM